MFYIPPFQNYEKLTVLRIKFGFYCNADGCSRQVHFISSVENSALKGHVIKNISLKVGGGCKSECVREKRCVSINVGPMVCELNEHDHIQHPLDLKPQEGFTYHSTKVRKLLLQSVKDIYLSFWFRLTTVLRGSKTENKNVRPVSQQCSKTS